MNSKNNPLESGRGMRSTLAGMIAISALIAWGITDANARGGRGGGGGGRMAQSSVSGAGAGRSMSRASSGNMGSGNRANTGAVNSGNRANTGNINSGNRANTGNINTGNRVNTGDINIGNDVNIDIDGGYGGGYWHGGGYHHPIAAGIAIGAVAVTTAAVMGSYYYRLPPGCTIVVRNGISYNYCGSVYYQQSWSGNDVVYIVVNP